MLQKHYEYTGSTIAKFILEDLNNQVKFFVKVFPKDYKKVIQPPVPLKGELRRKWFLAIRKQFFNSGLDLTLPLQGGTTHSPRFSMRLIEFDTVNNEAKFFEWWRAWEQFEYWNWKKANNDNRVFPLLWRGEFRNITGIGNRGGSWQGGSDGTVAT